MGDLGVSLRPPHALLLHHMAPVPPARSQIWISARLQPQPQTLPGTNASDEAVGR